MKGNRNQKDKVIVIFNQVNMVEDKKDCGSSANVINPDETAIWSFNNLVLHKTKAMDTGADTEDTGADVITVNFDKELITVFFSSTSSGHVELDNMIVPKNTTDFLQVVDRVVNNNFKADLELPLLS